ncbi:hypothetical protein K503DRAFT_768488 [Rhizopogon vinicolor AM-OR11-026]|uniref:Uncharacterized protein n=1 Tax=Rhizopogon vinicolor AM-OR11-026 TaxID=1314800 RepID=A0A1B7N6R6_9AGAM|nr:hypothetical protein K503DRAFT_768488 [Rhizopogon vinicolor AM-OR11-026]
MDDFEHLASLEDENDYGECRCPRDLPGILCPWHKPPRDKNKARRSAGAGRAIRNFAVQFVGELVERDMEKAAPLLCFRTN